jgi:UDP-N-acetylmuramoylalanine--D-glutamate ligase
MKNTSMQSKYDELDIGSNVHVLGCGVTGISVIRFLSDQGYDVIAHDESDIPKYFADCKKIISENNFRLGDKCYEGINSADTLIISPGISLKQNKVQQAIASGVKVIGDIDLFMRINNKPVVLVTGSNGKSTVSALLGEVLNRNGIRSVVCGNYGLPVLDALEDNADCYVIEISSFQLETTPNIHSTAAVVLNISEDHMDRYDSFNEYYHTKLHVYKNSKHKIINANEDYSKEISKENSDITISIGREADYRIIHTDLGFCINHNNRNIGCENGFKLIGTHNIFNISVVLALSNLLGVSEKDAVSVISEFPGLEHRTEFVANINDVTWINDSKATNVGATIAAIAGISKPVVLILGGLAKDANFDELCPHMENKVKKVIVFGKDKKRIIQGIENCIEYETANDMADVVKKAKKLSESGDVVLFSPSCASFDMFDNYQHRGEVFKEHVHMEVVDNA